MTIRKSHGVIHIPTGSRGTAQWPSERGWIVWFNDKDWKGDPAFVKRDRLVKLDCSLEELREE